MSLLSLLCQVAKVVVAVVVAVVVVVVVVAVVVVVDLPPRVKREGAGPTGQAVPLPRVMHAFVTLCWPSCHEMVYAHTPSNTDARRSFVSCQN